VLNIVHKKKNPKKIQKKSPFNFDGGTVKATTFSKLDG
jgi:hypothetical protein